MKDKKMFNIKIPKGTIVDIDGNSMALKDSLYAVTDGRTIILTNEVINTDFLTVDKRKMETMKTEGEKQKENKSDIPINRDIIDICMSVLKIELVDPNLKKNCEAYLLKCVEKATKQLDD